MPHKTLWPDLKVTLFIALIMGGIIFSAAAALDYRLAQIEESATQ